MYHMTMMPATEVATTTWFAPAHARKLDNPDPCDILKEKNSCDKADGFGVKTGNGSVMGVVAVTVLNFGEGVMGPH
jgi:hypothetical protein